MSVLPQVFADFPVFAWLFVLFALAISSLVQGRQVWARRTDWSKAAHPRTCRLAVAARLGGGLLLLLATTINLVFYFWLANRWNGYDEPWHWVFTDSMSFASLTAALMCLLPINAFRLSFEADAGMQRTWYWPTVLAAGVLLLLMAMSAGASIAVENLSVNRIVLAMGGANVWWDQGPYLIEDFRHRFMTYDWNEQFRLVPIGLLTFLVGLLALLSVVGLANLNRHRFRVEQAIDFAIVTLTLFIVLAVSLIEIWPRTNPFILDGLKSTRPLFWLSAAIQSAVGGGIVAWIFSYRPTEQYSLAPVADPFEPLTQPKQLLYAFVAGWLLIAFDQGQFVLLQYVLLIMVLQQIFGFGHSKGRLRRVLAIDRPVFLRNWILFAILLPLIALLMPLLPALLLSMSS